MAQSIIGQETIIEQLIIALLCNGNVLMEGLPGLATTRAIKTLSTYLESEFQRIQFTPDLLPSDVTGAEVYYSEGGKGEFKFQPGPIFGNLILADEINRAPAKVQAALLEAMEERQVTVAGTTHRLPDLFMVGDAVKRTIVLSAADISGMAFTPLVYPAINGLGIYTSKPAVEDRSNRGTLTGERKETVTYVFEKQGAYELPEIVITWRDLGVKELKKVVLPSLEVKIAAGVGAGGEIASQSTLTDGRQIPMGRLLTVLVLLALLSAIAWRFRHAMQSYWQTWRHARSQSEKAYFRRLREACRNNDSKTAYHRLMAWLNKTASDPGAATLKNFLEAVGSEKLSKEVGELERRLYKKTIERDAQIPWQGESLYRELAYWRNKSMQTKETTLPGEATLAPLNPQ